MAQEGARTVGLLGFGALARELVASFEPGEVAWTALTRGSADPAPGIRLAASLPDLLAAHPRAVVEVAGQGAVRDHVPALLDAGIPVVLASVGALADAVLAERLAAGGARLVIPSGAVGGLDYIRAVARLPDACIRYTSRKPLAGWADELAARGLDASAGEVTLFEGSPEEGARLYPRNLNAAFAIAQAALPAPLSVRVVADSLAAGNTHEIEVTSAAGTAFLRFVNVPSPVNPRSSIVTALSLAAELRKLLSREQEA